MLNFPPDSVETYMAVAEAIRLSKELSGGKAEVHSQFAVNLAPCTCDCIFCSFAKINGVFREAVELTLEQAISYVRQFESEGANVVYMMSTAIYPIKRFIELAMEIKKT